MTLQELRNKYKDFFNRANKRLFGDKKYRIYKNYLIIEFSKEIGKYKFAGYNIYKINYDSLDYIKSVEKNYKEFIDNLIKEGV
jgi:hypothetical protein